LLFSFAEHYDRQTYPLNAPFTIAGLLPPYNRPTSPTMRPGPRLLAIAALLSTTSAVLAQQPLLCPPSSAGRPCDTFHYHVQLYRPDTRGFAEVFGVNQFASQTACERARETQVQRNLKVVELFRLKGEERYEADRVGPCHCDATLDRTSPNFLTDTQRALQLRTQEEIRLRVRERLIDEKVTTDSEVLRGLTAATPPAPMLATPKLMPLPRAAAAAPAENATSDLHATKAVDTTQTSVTAFDLPLVDVLSGVAETPPPVATLAEEHIEPPRPVEQPKVSAEEQASAQEAAERFIGPETQRIQNVLQASAAIRDEETKEKIFEACMQRMNLLSNLRLLIEGSGMRSRLATVAGSALTEEERLAVIAKLFGSDMPQHWAPRDAADVILDDAAPEVAHEPERALRDSQLTDEQKKRALYLFLAQSQPTEEQRLWLSSVIDRFLQ
jgi:hypothetical protein